MLSLSCLLRCGASVLLCGGVTLACAADREGVQLPVSVAVIGSCSITQANAIAFGEVDLVNQRDQDIQGSGQVAVRCTRGAAVVMTLDQGEHATPASTCTALSRRLQSAQGDGLAYAVYANQELGTARQWGCAADNQVSFTAVSAGSARTISVMSKIGKQQDAGPGLHTDTLTVTVSF